MKVYVFIKPDWLKTMPHKTALKQTGIAVKNLNQTLRGRIRLLEKFIKLAVCRDLLEEEQESLLAFSGRISTAIINHQKQRVK